MCVHREHRTGNCGECWRIAHPVTSSSSTPFDAPNRYAQVIEMPLLWEGDDS